MNQLLAKDKDARPRRSEVAAALQRIFTDLPLLSAPGDTSVRAAPTVRHGIVTPASVSEAVEAPTVAAEWPVAVTPLSNAKVVLPQRSARYLVWLGGLAVVLAGVLVGPAIQRRRATAPDSGADERQRADEHFTRSGVGDFARRL